MNIVFVHFGKKLPSHLRSNMLRTAHLFEDKKIYLISDRLHKGLPTGLAQFIVDMDGPSQEVEKKLLHPREFRDNFWFTTLRRFLVFEQFMRQHTEPMLHIESDVLISEDFPFSKFETLSRKFAFPLISNIQGIPSVLFLQNLEAAIQLRNLTISESNLNPATTDMLILRKLCEQSTAEVLVLPSGPSDKMLYRQNTESEYLIFQKIGLDLFGGIFDGAVLGQYFFGDDPRNNRGIRNLFIDSKYSLLMASKLNCAFSPQRNFIDVESGNRLIPIFSLHIHSKDVRVFSEKKLQGLLSIRIVQSKHGMRSEFLLKIAISQILKSLKRRIFSRNTGSKE